MNEMEFLFTLEAFKMVVVMTPVYQLKLRFTVDH